MAKRILPNCFERFSIDRCELLSTAVGIGAASFVPNVKPSETALVVSAQSGSTASEAILKVSASTARRLAEIERRNELKREAKLPLLPIAKELRRMKELDDSHKFSEVFGPFAAKHRQAVWDEVLKPRREALGDPSWKPNWIAGMGYASVVTRILRERFEAGRIRDR